MIHLYSSATFCITSLSQFGCPHSSLSQLLTVAVLLANFSFPFRAEVQRNLRVRALYRDESCNIWKAIISDCETQVDGTIDVSHVPWSARGGGGRAYKDLASIRSLSFESKRFVNRCIAKVFVWSIGNLFAHRFPQLWKKKHYFLAASSATAAIVAAPLLWGTWCLGAWMVHLSGGHKADFSFSQFLPGWRWWT